MDDFEFDFIIIIFRKENIHSLIFARNYVSTVCYLDFRCHIGKALNDLHMVNILQLTRYAILVK